MQESYCGSLPIRSEICIICEMEELHSVGTAIKQPLRDKPEELFDP